MGEIRLPLTRLQRRVLQLVYEFIREKLYPPTVIEIQQALGIPNPGTVHKTLSALERKAYITKEKHVARGIRLTTLGEKVCEPDRQLMLNL